MAPSRRGPIWAFLALLACGPSDLPREVELAALLPGPGSRSGVAVAEGPREYLPETLFEPLNGGATVYLDYGFRRLRRCIYRLGDDARACVTLDVFDMGSPVGAFGIYRGALPEGAPVQPWGSEGHRVATVAAAWKGRIFVHAEADMDTPELTALLDRLVTAVCQLVPGPAELPPELRYFPQRGLIPRSERFVARDLLGHSFLPGGWMASYLVDAQRAEAFLSDLGNKDAARRALAALRAFHARSATGISGAPTTGDDGFRFAAAAGSSGAVVTIGRYVAGVQGSLPQQAIDSLLTELATNLAG